MQRLMNHLCFINAQVRGESFCRIAGDTYCAVDAPIAKGDLVTRFRSRHDGPLRVELDIFKISQLDVSVNVKSAVDAIGGNKSTRTADIKRAKAIAKELEF